MQFHGSGLDRAQPRSAAHSGCHKLDQTMVMAAPHSCARLCGAVLVLSGAALAAGAAVPRQASGSARTHVHMQGDNSMDLVGPLPGHAALPGRMRRAALQYMYYE